MKSSRYRDFCAQNYGFLIPELFCNQKYSLLLWESAPKSIIHTFSDITTHSTLPPFHTSSSNHHHHTKPPAAPSTSVVLCHYHTSTISVPDQSHTSNRPATYQHHTINRPATVQYQTSTMPATDQCQSSHRPVPAQYPNQ